ncbi:MAG: N-formylglutamate amidohydrolase [Steroidobacteraceae bacterium]|nr:N-formylglutamate amidohydrolase [Steroidobacteraceae bacterium]
MSASPSSAPAESLLGPGDPVPYEIHEPAAPAPVLLVCDHASRAFPRKLGRLGLPEEATWRHIAWDLGAAELTRALAHRLRAPAILAGYSRLVVDCNRRLDDPTCFAAVSDGQRVPGNEDLGDVERRARAAACHEPYHDAIERHLGRLRGGGIVPAVVAVHSFTPVYGAQARPWNVGILWDKDPRLPVPLLERLRREPGLVVGDNEPYSGRHPADYTIDRHAERPGLPHVCLEVRQDQLLTPAGIARWAEVLGRALADVLALPGVHEVWDAARATA